jgi:hypothetical protein
VVNPVNNPRQNQATRKQAGKKLMAKLLTCNTKSITYDSNGPSTGFEGIIQDGTRGVNSNPLADLPSEGTSSLLSLLPTRTLMNAPCLWRTAAF